ncbi:MAG TPA: hypothetical protein VHT21_08735 [Stellaceae bacterium]|jgi:hypothetical protein|nr:hypothetical protein [Stellaceae bacterium]
MKAGAGNEVRALLRALEKQDQHEERVQRRHKRRATGKQPKGDVGTAPKRK